METDNIINNPYFIDSKNRKITEEIYNIVILCLNDSNNIDDDNLIFSPKISIDNLNKLKNIYSLVPSNIQFLTHEKYFKITNIIEEKYLYYIDNNYDMTSNNNFIILELLYLKKKDVILLQKIYDKEFTFNDIPHIYNFIKYSIIDKNTSFIDSLTESLSKNFSITLPQKNIESYSKNIESVINLLKILRENKIEINYKTDSLTIITSLLINIINNKFFYNIFNNDNFMELLEEIFVENKSLFRYLIGFIWYKYYNLEIETNLKNINYLIDLKNANKMPYFPYLLSNNYIMKNPYIFVSDKNSKKHLYGVSCLQEMKDNPITSYENFENYMKLLFLEDKKNNLLEIMKKYNVIMYGLYISLCCQNDKPHELLYKSKTNLLPYFSIPLDLIIYSSNNTNYINTAYKLILDLANNENLEKIIIDNEIYVNIYISDKTEINSYSKDEIYNQYVDIKKINNTAMKMVKIDDSDNVYNNIFNSFVKIAPIDNINIIIDNKCEKNTIYYKYDKDKNKIYYDINNFDEKIKLIFKVANYDNFFTITSVKNYDKMLEYIDNLEFSIEKIFYDGENVKIFPSCITALMTNTNIITKNNISNTHFIEHAKKINDLGFGMIIYLEDYNYLLNKYNINNYPKQLSDLPYYYFCSLTNDSKNKYFTSDDQIFEQYYDNVNYELYELTTINSQNKLNKINYDIIISYINRSYSNIMKNNDMFVI